MSLDTLVLDKKEIDDTTVIERDRTAKQIEQQQFGHTQRIA